jgi:hypothetical protein
VCAVGQQVCVKTDGALLSAMLVTLTKQRLLRLQLTPVLCGSLRRQHTGTRPQKLSVCDTRGHVL